MMPVHQATFQAHGILQIEAGVRKHLNLARLNLAGSGIGAHCTFETRAVFEETANGWITHCCNATRYSTTFFWSATRQLSGGLSRGRSSTYC
eukprot:SAG31_NODE_1631_length_7698_cov_2.501908_5_plen_92_part_00